MVPFTDTSGPAPVRGFLHEPEQASGDALVLTHGAGSNCAAPLLVAAAETFTSAGYLVLRCDLPYRQKRAKGPPFGPEAAKDREGLRAAVEAVRKITSGRVFLSGHSYGGRQATMAASEDPTLANALLLLSYPLHPPNRPAELRTAHFPQLRIPALFVHGAKDPFGSVEEMRSAVGLIPALVKLIEVPGAGHDLSVVRKDAGLLRRVVEELQGMLHK